MFRPIRKKKNAISAAEAKKLLTEARRGVLAVNGDDGYPYAIPVNYYYDEENRRSVSISGKAVQMYEITIEHLSGKEVQER